MTRLRCRAVASALAMAACGGQAAPPPPGPPAVPHDAGAIGDALSAIVGFDPRSGMHLDDDVTSRPGPRAGAAPVRLHPIDVTLRSSPPGALAAVDGVPVGTTPSLWAGDANGREHEFTFVLPGYAVARYRFVPITSGVVHARMDAVNDDLDGGIGDTSPTLVAPSQVVPSAPLPPATMIDPPAPRPVPRPVPAFAPAVDAQAPPGPDATVPADGATPGTVPLPAGDVPL